MKTFSVKSKFVMVLALVLALCGSLVLALFDGGQKTIEQNTVALAGPENTDKFWTDDGIRGTHFSGGAGTEASPYLIGSAEELAFLAYQVNENGQIFAGKYFALTADVDLSDYYWRPIGLEYDSAGQNLTRPFAGSFSGSYDGVQHTISGLYTQPVPEGLTDATALRAYNNQGLFGYINFLAPDNHIDDISVSFSQQAPSTSGDWSDEGIRIEFPYTGSPGRYYIDSPQKLGYLSYAVNVLGNTYSGYRFLLRANIDMSDYYWTPIGTGSHVFAGTIENEGNYQITNIKLNPNFIGGANATYKGQGLFVDPLFVDKTNTITHVVIEDSLIQGGVNVGAVVGHANTSVNYSSNTSTVGEISFCVNNGQVIGSSAVSGIARGSVVVKDCINNGPVTSTSGSASGVGGDYAVNCVNNASGIVTSAGNGAGIGGSNATGCVNYADIYSSGDSAGGILISGRVTDCINYGDIYCEPESKPTRPERGLGTGGIAAYQSSVLNSANYGNVTGGGCIGGLVGSLCLPGSSSNDVLGSYNMGQLTANEKTLHIGGLLGWVRLTWDYGVDIANCYNAGDIYAEEAVAGGLIGNLYGKSDTDYGNGMANCFNVGDIHDGSEVYGFSSINSSAMPISSCYYNNTDSQGQPLPAGGNGTYLAALASLAKTQSFFEDESYWLGSYMWDFRLTWTINPSVNDGYPSFNQTPVVYWTDDSIRANSFGGGSGTQEDPYLIETAEQLAYLAYMVNSGQGPYVESMEMSDGIYLKHFYQGVYFKQTQPIDLSKHVWPGIGVYDMTALHFFAGNYDGGGFEISGMYAVGEMVAGLFRTVGNDPLPAMAPGTPGHEELSPITIENIVLVEPTVNAIEFEGGSYSGGIIGALFSAVDVTVQNCSVQGGFVGGADGAGGIVGMMAAMQSKIVNCQNSATVAGGGIVGGSGTTDGVNVNIVFNCVNSGQAYGAGIILDARGINLINCINNGAVEAFSSYAAGIAGSLDSNSSVIGCVNNGQISGSATYAGGLVGELVDAQIINSYNTGDLNVSAEYAGGLVGYSGYTGNRDTDNSIARSYNIGSVTNTKNNSSTSLIPYTAGILAYSYKRTNISNCYNKGNITSLSENASSYTAGIIAVGTVSDDGQYKNIYNTGTVTANSNIGGIIGCTGDSTYYDCDLDNAFNTGNVVYNGSSDSAYIGGVAANAIYVTDVANAYYGGACPSSVPAFGTGSGTNVSYLDNLDSLAKTEEWFTTETNWNSTSLWDFANTWAITEGENDGYPVLIELDWWINSENVASSFAGGSGTEEDPYLIETPAQLAYLSFAVYYGLGPTQAIRNYTVTFIDTYFKQTANIDLSGHLWLPIGTQSGAYGEESSRFFGGNYDGGGFYITGMTFVSWTVSNGVALGYPYGIFGLLAGGSSEQSMQVIENIVIGNPEAEFTIQAPGYVGGVAGVILQDVTIRNCTNYANITATMDAEGYGGIVGYPQGGNIIGCTNYGTITGCDNTGGIAGGNAPYGSDIEIANSYNYGNIVSNGNYVGGIAGQAIVSDCINYATVSGVEDVGGVVGDGTASTSANHGDVTGQTNVGGVLGYALLELSYDCFNTGSVTGQTGVGGVVGKLYGSLYRSYSTGAVSGTENVGGVIGLISSSGEIDITNTFAIGSISGTTNVGGVVGRSQGNDSSSVIGSTNHYGGSIPSSIPFIGDSTETYADVYIADLDEKAKQQSFFEDYDVWNGLYIWDFAKVWTFKTGENDGYPVFSDVQTWIDAGIRGTSFGGGSGTKDAPYIISSAEELAYLSYMIYTSQAPYTTENVSIFPLPFFYQDTYFKQTADIDLSAYYWSPIGASLNATTTTMGIFAGHYDGGGYTISGLKTLNGPSFEYANQALFGLFGPANYPASISNVILENTDITGRMTVAGLVGTVINSDAGNTATISNCHHYGNLYLGNYEEANNVGGIVGISFVATADLVLENCSNAGNIDVANEQANAGGIVGHWTGNLSATNIQSFASISGGQNVGAFAGAFNFSAYLSADKTVTVETALLTGTLSGTNVGGFAGLIETQTTATTNTVTVSRVGYEVDIISATTAGVIAPSISGSNISFTNSYAIIDASQTSISQFTTQAEGMTQGSSLYYVETASGENRYYAGNDFSDFVWVDDSPCPIMADFVWMGEDLLRIYYESYGEGYMTNLITSSSSGWQAIA